MKQFLYIFLISFVFFTTNAQQAFIPEPTLKVVSDFENILSDAEEEEIAKFVKQEYKDNSNQLFVLTIPTAYLNHLSIEDYSQQLFEKWKPGQKELNNGVILIVCGSKIDSIGRKLRIHTGYGVDAVLPDLLCKKIEMELMVPELKKGHYFKAINDGAKSITSILSSINIGTKPTHKVNYGLEKQLIYDYAMIFNADEKKQLEKKLSGIFNNRKYSIYTEINYDYSLSYTTIFNKSSYDTNLVTIYYNPGYYLDLKDSLYKYDVNHASNYIIIYSNDLDVKSTDYDKMHEFHLSFQKQIQQVGLASALEGVFTKIEQVYLNKFYKYLFWYLLLLLVPVFLFGLKKFIEPKTKALKSNSAFKFCVRIILIVTYLESFLSLLSIELLWYFLLNDYLQLNDWLVISGMIAMAVSNVFSLIYITKIDALLFKGILKKLFNSSGSSGNSYSSSSYSSSSSSYSSSSSSSSYSSSSNSNYYGGGGSSGGGGASSDW